MAEFIPLFPLNLVAFPGEKVNLHIFEPRYRQMIEECLEQGTTFGLLPALERDKATIATEMRVQQLVQRHAGGEMDISTKGVRRVRVTSFQRIATGKLYPGGWVEWLDEDDTTDPFLQQRVFDKLIKLHELLGIQEVAPDLVNQIRAFEIGHHLGLSLQQEYELLAFGSERERLVYLLEHLRRIFPIITETERLKTKAKLNGHFKQIPPAELP